MAAKEPAQAPTPATPAPDEPQRRHQPAPAAPQRAAPAGQPTRVARSAALAGTVGNRAMQRLVSQPGDPHEREADRIAAQLTRPGTPGPTPGRDRTTTPAAAPGPGSSGGQPLDPDLRAGFEARLGTDLSAVRVHTDPRAGARARALRATAFTVGSDIAFAPGAYAPSSPRGRTLIAHELAHVLQQSGQLGEPLSGVIQRNGDPEPAPAPEQGPETEPAQTAGPGPEGPREDTPAVPRAGARRAWFRNVMLSDDRDFMRGEIRRLIAARGLAGADEWLRMLHGWRPATVGVPFSAHTRHLGPGMQSRSAADALRQMQREQEQNALRDTVTEVFAEVRADAVAYLDSFEQRAREVTLSILDESETRTEAERMRYGLERDVDITMNWRREPGGGYGPNPEISVTNRMDRSVSSQGLVGAAQDLQAKKQEIMQLGMERDRLLRRIYSHAVVITTLPPENEDEYERLGEEVEERRHEYDLLRRTYEERYPILAVYGENYAQLSRIAAQGVGPETAALLNNQTLETLGNIAQVRGELHPGGRVQVWKLPEIVALTKDATGAAPGTTRGAMRERVVDDKVRAVESEERWRTLALTVLAIGLALLAAIPSGGSSLVAGATAVAAIGSFGLGAYTAVQSIQRYRLESAMAGTDFDRARAISAEDPSLFWLALDIVGAALDLGPALRGARVVLTASQQTFRRIAPAARQALTASRNAGSKLEELRRLATDEGGVALAARVTRSVQRLRRSRGSVQELAGAAGHESRAVREAGEALATEARRPLGEAAAAVDGHTVKVLPGSGRLVRCTTCGFLREEFATELARHPELSRRLADIEAAARVAADSGDRVAAQAAAERASELADELQHARVAVEAALAAPSQAANWPQVRQLIGKPAHGTALPPGYTVYERQGRTVIRRQVADDARMARLTVDEHGMIQLAGTTRRSRRALIGRPTLPRGAGAGRLGPRELRVPEPAPVATRLQAEHEEILALHATDPLEAGRRYQDVVARDLRGHEVQEMFSRPLRRMDIGPLQEVTLEGWRGPFSTPKLDQLWLDLRDNGQIILHVPRLSPAAADQLARLGAQARDVLGVEPLIIVRQSLGP